MPGIDFLSQISTLTFDSQSSGRLCAVVAIILDDDVAENDEVFTVQLQAGGSVDVLANGSSAIVTIISDDGKPSLFVATTVHDAEQLQLFLAVQCPIGISYSTK